jgi:hypothetical protein
MNFYEAQQVNTEKIINPIRNDISPVRNRSGRHGRDRQSGALAIISWTRLRGLGISRAPVFQFRQKDLEEWPQLNQTLGEPFSDLSPPNIVNLL